MAKRNDLLTGTAIGIGLGVLVPVVVSVLTPVVQPLVRSAVKAGVRVYERGREMVGELGEAAEDVRAEVQQELFDAREGAAQEHSAETPVELR